ncbi:MAG: tetratricopeptide repeat protein [Methylococcaceae bacterium]|nr:MAG: tetratricopeptide repeat protein [Methylococcaceae bacterium]
MSSTPLPAKALLQSAIKAEQQGNITEALTLCEQACLQDDAPLVAITHAARLAQKLGQPKKAAQYYRQALNQQPSNQIKLSLVMNCLDANELDEAEQTARQVIAKNPKEHPFINLLGIILKRRKQLAAAVEMFSKAAKIAPKFTSAWVNLGNTYLQLSQTQKALECFNKACQLEPQSFENRRLLGQAYLLLGQYEKALEALQAALKRAPNHPRILSDIAHAYYRQSRYAQALETVERGLQSHPEETELLRWHGSVLRKLGRVEEAARVFKGLLRQHPDDIDTLVFLGNLHAQSYGDRARANALYARAYALDTSRIATAVTYCSSLARSRYGDEIEHFEKAYDIACRLQEQEVAPVAFANAAQSVFLRAVDYERYQRLGPRSRLLRHWLDQGMISELLNQLSRVENLEDRLELVRLHREWGDKVQARAAEHPIRHPPKPPRQKIRIGILSSDLREHPVAYFAHPILELYDRSRFELYCYSFDTKQPDKARQHFSEIVDQFRLLLNVTDQEAAQRMADDQLDILFELGGTTHMNRIEVCAYRPAPVQVSWLGYPHSSGLSSIDYLLADPYTLPERTDLLIEKPFLMPESWVTLGELGFRDIAITEGTPESRNGHITFGTMNNPYKYTPRAFAAWAAVMRGVENSHFLFVRPESGGTVFRGNVCREFAKHGIAAERIEFFAVRGAHLPHYNSIDIALDPFPHVGGTTTCESLWMGVPVVTLIGPAFFERLSYSNLSNAGLGDLCANTVDEYVQIAIDLAADGERRRQLRHGLREQIRSHPLGQTERFVRHFEQQVVHTLAQHGGSGT